MPGKGTALRNVRIDSELWDRAKFVAELRETTVSDVIRDCLQRYVDEYEREQESRD
jgi:antitoxin component of RelBE/YafQ-DinJ toxin-antitoxin module